MICVHSNSAQCQSHWRVSATKNLHVLIYICIVSLVSFFTILFFLNFQLSHPLHTTSAHTFFSLSLKIEKIMLWRLLILSHHTTIFIPWPALYSIFYSICSPVHATSLWLGKKEPSQNTLFWHQTHRTVSDHFQHSNEQAANYDTATMSSSHESLDNPTESSPPAVTRSSVQGTWTQLLHNKSSNKFCQWLSCCKARPGIPERSD